MRAEEVTQIVNRIQESTLFLVTSHVDPDGDAIGSLLGLSLGLISLGKSVWPYIHKPLKVPYSRLTGADILRTDLPEDLRGFVCIALDCASPDRLGVLKDRLDLFRCVINIDHHVTNPGYGDLNWVDPAASSVGEMVLRILNRLDVDLQKEGGIAENLYYAIQTDTGGFRFENTTLRALVSACYLMATGLRPWDIFKRTMNTTRIQRLRLICEGLNRLEFLWDRGVCILGLTQEVFERAGAELEDSEELAEVFRSLDGVKVSIVAREVEPNRFKFSMRSDGSIDLSSVARAFGGGGHRMAAGFEFNGTFEEATQRLKEVIEEAAVS